VKGLPPTNVIFSKESMDSNGHLYLPPVGVLETAPVAQRRHISIVQSVFMPFRVKEVRYEGRKD
jgi:hypothetical protein